MTLNEYMNDPAIIHEPQAMREIHAIRLQIQDETRNLTSAEYTALVHKRSQAFLAEPVTIETDLTAEERAIIADGERHFQERPEDFISLDDYLTHGADYRPPEPEKQAWWPRQKAENSARQ
jgi:hypothetical protein